MEPNTRSPNKPWDDSSLIVAPLSLQLILPIYMGMKQNMIQSFALYFYEKMWSDCEKKIWNCLHVVFQNWAQMSLIVKHVPKNRQIASLQA